MMEDWRRSDIPDVVAFPSKHYHAAREYDCSNCPKKIKRGELYEYCPILVDGVFEAYRRHHEYCYADDEDGSFEEMVAP